MPDQRQVFFCRCLYRELPGEHELGCEQHFGSLDGPAKVAAINEIIECLTRRWMSRIGPRLLSYCEFPLIRGDQSSGWALEAGF